MKRKGILAQENTGMCKILARVSDFKETCSWIFIAPLRVTAKNLEITSMSMDKCMMAQLYMGYIAVKIRKQEIHYQYRWAFPKAHWSSCKRINTHLYNDLKTVWYVAKRYTYWKKKYKEVQMPLRGRKEMKLGKGTQEAIKVKCLIS